MSNNESFLFTVLTYPDEPAPPPEDDGKMQVPLPIHNSKDSSSEQFIKLCEAHNMKI